MGLRVVVGIGILLVIGILIHQVYGWRRGSIIVSQKQKVYRISEGLLMIAVLGMIMVGDRGVMAHFGKLAVVYYWMACFVFAVVPTVFAMLDLREVGQQFGRQREAALKDLIDLSEKKKEE